MKICTFQIIIFDLHEFIALKKNFNRVKGKDFKKCKNWVILDFKIYSKVDKYI